MKKFFTISLILFFTIITTQATFAGTTKPKKTYTEREYTVKTSDGHLLHAYLSYPKTKLKGYPTIVMLHSLGYNSRYWIPLQVKFNNLGYAVIRVDLRGHGKSVYDKNFHQRSWRSFKNETFMKYPQDIVETINFIKAETKKVNFYNWAIIGSDIGANTAILVAKSMPVKPKALVLMGPSMTFKGLYVPVAMTEIGNAPILAIASKTDTYSMQEQTKLSKFAQGTFEICNTKTGSSGMLLLSQQPAIQNSIINWLTAKIK
ncbi:MAG: alpha/beta hydrolase [Candidatus Gastranaerophilaceae bacterium]